VGDGRLELYDYVAGTGTEFSYQDRDVEPGLTYRYQIGIIDDDGEFFSQIVSVRATAYDVALMQNTPNPFNPATTIRFSLDRSRPVTLSVFDARGAHVTTLIDEVRGAGLHEARWDGTDRRGTRVSSGVYYYRLRAGSMTHSRRMVLLK
jgi:hypothetical protein